MDTPSLEAIPHVKIYSKEIVREHTKMLRIMEKGK